MCTPCNDEAKMAIHQIGPESAALAMNIMIQQSPITDDTWIKEKQNMETSGLHDFTCKGNQTNKKRKLFYDFAARSPP